MSSHNQLMKQDTEATTACSARRLTPGAGSLASSPWRWWACSGFIQLFADQVIGRAHHHKVLEIQSKRKTAAAATAAA